MSNVETVKAIYDAFGRGEVDAVLDQLAEDVEWDRDARGHAGLRPLSFFRRPLGSSTRLR
jgi:ketosteroid isomerase-like protein